MANISTKYLGLELKSPVIASSSDFTSNIENIIELEKAGCGAIVLKSIFEEQILMEIDSLRMNNMFDSYSDNENYIAYYTKKHEVDSYLQLIKDAKKQIQIPVIASVHCSTNGKWTEFLPQIEKAGADAIEINAFILPSNPNTSADEIEKSYISIIEAVRKNTKLPIALKLHHYFTDIARIFKTFAQKVDSLVLFNRFFNPDIDIENFKINSGGSFSLPEDNYLIQRWIGIIRPLVNCNLAASGGIYNSETAIKNLLAGADVIQIASVLYKNGVETVTQINEELKLWMQKKSFTQIADFKGKMSQSNIPNSNLYERAQFMKYFSDFNKE